MSLLMSSFIAGIMVVVPNYTGDCLNFGIAIEKARQAGVMVKLIKSLVCGPQNLRYKYITLRYSKVFTTYLKIVPH